MQCPKCEKPLCAEESCHSCPSCGGVWFNVDEARCYFNYEDHVEIKTPHPSSLMFGNSPYTCPACLTQLSHIQSGDKLHLEQCGRCKGLYFDAGESIQLRSMLARGFGEPDFLSAVREMIELIAGTHRGPYR